jgi:hypothetical protein
VDDRRFAGAALCQIDAVTREPLLTCLWPVLRRDPGTVQFGLDPAGAVVLTGVTDEQAEALRALDGTHRLPPVLDASPDLVGLLRRRRILVTNDELALTPEPARGLWRSEVESLVRAAGPRPAYAAWSRRTAARVVVAGRGPLPSSIAALLRRAGVGAVRVVDAGAAEHPGTAPLDPPTLVVHTAAHAVDPVAGERWRRHGIPVLPVVLTAAEAVVGPVCTTQGPCLRCLDLTRADLDPDWPALLGQLTRPRVGPTAEVGGEVPLVAVAAGLATTLALSTVDGLSTPPGRSLEVSMPWPAVRQRQWERHPQCGCGTATAVSRRSPQSPHHARGHAADRPSGQPADAAEPAQARMAG